MSQEESFVSKLKKYRKEIIVGIIIILLVVFMVQNSHDVRFRLVFTDMEVPLIVLVLGFAGLGAGTVGVYWALSSKDKKRTIKDLGAEVGSLKKIIADSNRPVEQKDSSAE